MVKSKKTKQKKPTGDWRQPTLPAATYEQRCVPQRG